MSKKKPSKDTIFDRIEKQAGLSKEQREEVNDLMKVPKQEKGKNQAHQQVSARDVIHEADTIQLPTDQKKRYALVVTDMGSGHVDSEPIKSYNLTAKSTVEAFKRIYSRKYLSMPKIMIQVDQGNEFKGPTQEYFENNGVIVKRGRTGRSRQQAQVETYNYFITRAIFRIQNAEELKTGKPSKKWVSILPIIIKVLNENRDHTPKKYDGPPKCEGSACKLLKEGTKVRVILEKPQDIASGKRLQGNFRAGDIRWERKIRKIKQVLIKPDQPPMYLVEGYKNTAFTKNQLQVVD